MYEHVLCRLDLEGGGARGAAVLVAADTVPLVRELQPQLHTHTEPDRQRATESSRSRNTQRHTGHRAQGRKKHHREPQGRKQRQGAQKEHAL